MKSINQLSSRLAHASYLLRKSSVKSAKLIDKDTNNGKVQTSWGSAMRR